MFLAFIGSLFLPLLGLFTGGGDQRGISTTQEDQAYQQWIGSNVSAALSGYGGLGLVQYLGVQFGDSTQGPIIGLLVEGLDPQSDSGRGALQSYSIEVLRRLFTDERAQSATLVWLGPASDSGSGELRQEVFLMVGMLRQTAQGISWATMGPADLRYVADYYQEQPPTTTEESL